MTGLRQSVADAIQRDMETGGSGILTDQEIAALEWAITTHEDGTEQHRESLAVLLHELGRCKLRIHGAEDRRDPYWLHCADVAINAYDEWLDKRKALDGK